MLTFEQHQALAEIYKRIKDKKYSVTRIQIILNGKGYNKNNLTQLANQDLLEKTTKTIMLTKKGLETAYHTYRTFAVLGIFCQEILGLSRKEAEEHIQDIFFSINNYLLEKYCALIGHAIANNIPRGNCCTRAEIETSEQVIPLSKLPLNTSATLMYIKTPTQGSIQKIFDLGLYPGQTIKIFQHYPIYIVQVDKGEVALEQAAANNIFVKK
jgi:Mn-dependent DtxR family transcriptional regulator/Fe2+ transport system protein FeoA